MASVPEPKVPPKELLKVVQGDILAGGIPKRREDFVFFSIEQPEDFCRILHDETTLDLFSSGKFVANRRAWIKAGKAANIEGLDEDFIMAIANISFSATGLRKLHSVLPKGLGISEEWETRDEVFWTGMEADARDPAGLRDRMDQWDKKFLDRKIDGLILIAGSNDRTIKLLAKLIFHTTFGASVSIVKVESGAVREGKFKDREHFGFNDGVSQPTVEGFAPDNSKVTDGSVGALGERWNTFPQSTFVVQDADGSPRPEWTEHGSFLVYRKLEQDVAKWNEAIQIDAKKRKIDPTLLAAKIVGRWPGGCPVMVRSDTDDKAHAFNNEFDFNSVPRSNGIEHDHICPGGAHIRKMNPQRAVPGKDGYPITLGAMIRRGITYGTDYDEGRGEGDRGLHFVCYQSSIDLSFRNVQVFRANADEFPIPGSGVDSITGNPRPKQRSRMVISNNDQKSSRADFEFENFNPFVKCRGGEYFFTPSLKALKDNLSLPSEPAAA